MIHACIPAQGFSAHSRVDGYLYAADPSVSNALSSACLDSVA
ncbi:hypothetical protein MGSAQ_002918 [marine sediment metagenome]|uniref:Uncharacterized protein n=1 Tax=marine sediment metagenome TaxID=412755 RepID=A0A1B6NRP8_9ZZZZ